jgi:drug/metabolite transporter (DMT)-like permease
MIACSAGVGPMCRGTNGVVFILYYVAVAGLRAVTASTATYIPPVVAMIIGTTILGEPVQPSAVVALVLILIAAIIAQTSERAAGIGGGSGRRIRRVL